MADQIRVQFKFTEPTDYGDYTDALYFTESEWANRDMNAVKAMKAERVLNYIDRIRNAPAPVEPSKADLQAEKADLLARIAVLDAEIAEK